MKNTEKLRNLLSLALQNTPDDFALQEIKGHIRHAIVKLDHVETKRTRREQVQTVAPVPSLNSKDLRHRLDAIDELISTEKLKIEEISNRRKGNDDGDGDDVQTIFG